MIRAILRRLRRLLGRRRPLAPEPLGFRLWYGPDVLTWPGRPALFVSEIGASRTHAILLTQTGGSVWDRSPN